MARLLGEARVAVLPDGTRFRPEAEAAIKKATAGLKGHIKFDADTKGVDAAMARIAAARAADMKAEQKQIDSRKNMYASMFDQIAKDQQALVNKMAKGQQDISKRLAKERADLAKRIDFKLGIDSSRADKDMAALRKRLKYFGSGIKIDPRVDGSRAERDAAGLRERIKLELRDMKIKIRAVRDNASFSNFLGFLRGKFKSEMEKASADAGNGAGHSLMSSLAKSAVMQNPAITAGVVAGLAALPAAIGAVGVLGGIALGAGLIFGAQKLINSQIKSLTSSIKSQLTGNGKLAKDQLAVQNAQTAVANAGVSTRTKAANPFAGQQSQIAIQNKQLAIQNTQATIARLSGQNKLTASQQQQLVSAKARLVIEKQSLALTQAQAAAAPAAANPAAQNKAKASAQGRLAVAQQQLKTDQATAKLNNSNQNYTLKQQQQQLAQYQAYQQSFFKLNDAIKNAKASFAQFVITATKPLLGPFTDAVNYLSGQLKGPLAKSFHDLFKAVGPLVKPVLQSLLEIVKGVLPGLTMMLNKARGPLGKLFIDFGKIVGVRLGDWFRAAIPYIKDSATYFIKLINFLGKVGVFLIKFGGESAKAFGNPALKGFGPLIKQIADDIIKLLKPALDGWIGVMGPVAKDLLKILVPILNFLAVHPGYVKAIFAIIAAFMLFQRLKVAVMAIMGVKKALEGVSKGTWIGLLITAIVLVTTLIITHWGQISRFLIMVWKHIWSGFIGPLINFFTQTIPHAFGVTLNWLKKWWPFIIPIILGPVGIMAALIIKYHNQIFNFIKRIWNAVWGFIKRTWDDIWGFAKQWWPLIFGTAGLIFKYHKQIWAFIQVIWHAVFNFLKRVWDDIKGAIGAAISWVASKMSSVWNGIKHVVGAVWGWIHDKIKDIWDGLKRVVGDAIHWIAKTMSDVWNGIKNTAHDIWTKIVQGIQKVWNGIKQVVKDPINVVIRFINTMIDGVDAVLSFIGFNKGGGPHGGPIHKIPGLATGGRINQGTHGTADDVLIRVSKGETVLSENHSKHLAPLLGQIGVPGYAKGGHVGKYSNLKYGNPGFDIPGYAKGGAVRGADIERTMMNFMLSKKGHPYSQTLGRFGPKYFDCSGLVYDAAHAAGLPLPRADALANLEIDWFSRLPGAYTYTGRSQTQAGDIVGMRGADPINGIGHIGMALGGGKMISAFDTAEGVNIDPISGFVRGVSLAGAGGNNVLKNLGSLALKGLGALGGLLVQDIFGFLQVPGIPNPLIKGIQSILGLKGPGAGNAKGIMKDLVLGVPKYMIGKATGWLKHQAWDKLKSVFAPQIAAAEAGGGGPGGAFTGSIAGGGFESLANLVMYARYFMQNGLSASAAAGMAGTISGEQNSLGPESRGSGGWGLIGWTGNTVGLPAGYHGPTGNVKFDLAQQLRGVIGYMNARGGRGPLNAAGNPVAAGNVWSRYEAPRVPLSDTRPATAMAVYNALVGGMASPKANPVLAHTRKHAMGGVIREPVFGVGARTGVGYSFGEGGRHERVLTDAQTQQYGKNTGVTHQQMNMMNSLLNEQNCILRRIADSSRNSAKSLGGTGRGVL